MTKLLLIALLFTCLLFGTHYTTSTIVELRETITELETDLRITDKANDTLFEKNMKNYTIARMLERKLASCGLMVVSTDSSKAQEGGS